jgi:hypothetical protein
MFRIVEPQQQDRLTMNKGAIVDMAVYLQVVSIIFGMERVNNYLEQCQIRQPNAVLATIEFM